MPPTEVQGAGRAFLGLAVLGWGLSILLGVVPHEDPLVGGGLALFGAALLATAPAFPARIGLPRWPTFGAGVALAAGTLVYDAVRRSPLDGPKAGLVALGLFLAASSPFLARHIRLGRRHRAIDVSTIVACALAVLAAPLAVWAVQASFKSTLASTPVEWFVRIGLLVPLGAFLALLGLSPSLDGQTITYATPRGPLSLEVGAACSGIQAMALFGAVLALYLLLEKPAGGRLAAWSLIGLGGVYVANLLRLALLAVVGYRWGTPALLAVHAEAGWTFFVAWALLFAWLARRSSDRAKARATTT